MLLPAEPRRVRETGITVTADRELAERARADVKGQIDFAADMVELHKSIQEVRRIFEE